MNFKTALFIVLLCVAQSVSAEIAETDSFKDFIKHMVKQHHFKESALRKLFKSVEIQQTILEAISKPAEAKPWFQYRELFMTETRIAGGLQFWRENEKALRDVEGQYGVPAQIIIAIIGVETRYGAHPGKYRVIDALSTLGFAYPPRSEFFLKELESFLLLAREEHINPLQAIGSYAGAMGLPQFMPSSFRHFAADFDGDHRRDIWRNPGDAIASVARYFKHNQWQAGAPIAFPVTAAGDSYRQALSNGVKPDVTVSQLRAMQVVTPGHLADSSSVKLLSYQLAAGEELWVGLHNFYVITRYNHSPLYAMAVYQLSQAIADRKKHGL